MTLLLEVFVSVTLVAMAILPFVLIVSHVFRPRLPRVPDDMRPTKGRPRLQLVRGGRFDEKN